MFKPLTGLLVIFFFGCAHSQVVTKGLEGEEARYQHARALLQELVAVNTTNPPGNEDKASRVAARVLKEAKISYEIVEFAPGRSSIVARLKGDGSQRPLLLLSHSDVVGVKDQYWESDPHLLTERDGFLLGRGSDDDHGPGVIQLETLLELKRRGIKLKRDVILAWTGDEESNGEGLLYLLKKRPELIDAEIAINEGGQLILDGSPLQVRYGILQVGEKTYNDFSLETSGPTGHSSIPLTENAIEILGNALSKLSRHKFPIRLLPATRAYFQQRALVERKVRPHIANAMERVGRQKVPPNDAIKVLESEPVLNALLRTTCVATLVSGGTRANALPAKASATLNCRILPDETWEQVQTQLEAVVKDKRVKIKVIEPEKSSGTVRSDGEVPKAILKVGGQMWPGFFLIPGLSRSATDSRWLRTYGIQAYGLSPISTTEEDLSRMHGANERIRIQSFKDGLEFSFRLVQELAAFER